MKTAAALLLATSLATTAATPENAARAVNALGLDLHRKLAATQPTENLCISPYSIQSALAMTFAGASGATRTEMARVLHYEKGGDTLHDSFNALQVALNEASDRSAKDATAIKKYGGSRDAMLLRVANRLFGQKGYDFRQPFTALVKANYGAPLEALDFRKSPDATRKHINSWVEDQTRDRIRDLIPRNAITTDTALVLANAIYFKAPWASEFPQTADGLFHIGGGAKEKVPTMTNRSHFGYAKRRDFTAVTVPYSGHDLHFLIILPNAVNGLAAVEKQLDTATLTQLAKATPRKVLLHLPKFKITPPTAALSSALKALGMKSAFDEPRGSADFDAMAPRKPDDYLFISEVFHKTFLALDEKGTEAAAATAVVMRDGSAQHPEQPIEVRVDRPFVFAIQHAASGACLFLGHLNDPRQ